MRHYITSLLCLLAFGKCVIADSAIAQGLARIVLLQQGMTPDEIAQFAVEETQRSYEQALGYYENYQYEETAVFDTTSGPIKGAKFNESYAFYSIPFAEPPVRFQDPVAITSPLTMIDATKADIVVCEQRPKNCSNGVCTQNTNEDCLLLNIHVPLGVEITASGATTSVRPVLVWFHGGGFFTGAGTLPEFEARYFAEQTDVIMVSVNYRLGAFGFLVHGDGANAINGNFGFKDQQLALQWVQENIKKFGGNPDLVTIFGNSAGAQSVMLHLVSDKSKPYFNRAIMESNPAVFPYQTLDEAKRVSARLVKILNCPGTVEEEQRCLMESDPMSINTALPLVMARSLIEDQDLYSTIEAFRPVLDGDEFDKQPFELFRDGGWNSDKDVILGTNANELEMIQFYIPRQTPGGTPIPFPRAAFRALNRLIFGNDTGDIVSDRYEKDYGGGALPDYRIILGFEASHMFFMCPSRLMARFASTTSDSGRVYLYNNAQPMHGQACEDVVKPPQMCGLAFHGSEPPFVFRSGPFYGYEFDESDTSGANQFDYYWTNFAVTGNPSDKGFIEGVGHNLGPYETWPAYTDRQVDLYDGNRLYRAKLGMLGRSTPPWQNIRIDGDNDPGHNVQEAYMEDICDFWDNLNYYVDLPQAAQTTSGTEVTTTLTEATKSAAKVTTSAVEATTSGCEKSSQAFLSVYLLSLILVKLLK